MGKMPIFITIMVALSLFISVDYYLNYKGQLESSPAAIAATDQMVETPAKTPLANRHIQSNSIVGNYRVVRQFETNDLFEKISLSGVENIVQTRSELALSEGQDPELIIYEVQGKVGQGGITYLDVKLQMVAQINQATESINENSQFGHNSLYLNDQNNLKTAFLLVQAGDNLYGFQYERDNEVIYNQIQNMIESLL